MIPTTDSVQVKVMDFAKFNRAISKQFNRMQQNGLFFVDADNDSLWNTYIGSFPEGTNLTYRKRTEHDCACCRSFIKRAGKLVSIFDGKVETIWDFKDPVDEGYRVVADKMSELVKSVTIVNKFLTSDKIIGTEKNFENLIDKVKCWEHFFVNVPAKYIMKAAKRQKISAAIRRMEQSAPVEETIGTKHSEFRATYDVMLRSLTELTVDSIDTVLELIAQNSLYRGEEHKFAVESFKKLKADFDKIQSIESAVYLTSVNLFVWSKIDEIPASVSRIRNTAIGTLLVDLSNGKELEQAVKAFEAMVAPANYKRPTAVVSKIQVQKAKDKITELGLTSALERRYATISDISINNLIFADRGIRKAISNDVFDDIVTSTKKSFDKVEEVPIDKFIENIIPKATSIEIMVENRHSPNMVSLVAPVDATAGKLFKWPNNFSWSYNGDMADAIKERVKKAGGNVTGEVCCRLAWDYTDDLDFHMHEPGGYKIYYTNKRKKSPSGGMLDVDANGGDGVRSDPVENIYYEHQDTMKEGLYRLVVHNFNRRSQGVGFEVNIDIKGEITKIVYNKVIRDQEWVDVATLKYSSKDGLNIVSSLPSTQVSQVPKKLWGISTHEFKRVNAIMLSPNFWDTAIGNKHYFFMIDGCKNDGTARGFYNEFLKSELDAHRKVIEMVGSKMRTEQSDHQLSGVGFSSTQRNEVLVRVSGAFTRTVKVIF